MAMPINELMVFEGDGVYYTPAFRRMIESHIPWLRSREELVLTPVDPHTAYKYEGDLEGLLLSIGVEPRHHWFIMRLNNMTSPQELTADRTSLWMLPVSYLELLLTRYKTTTKKVA